MDLTTIPIPDDFATWSYFIGFVIEAYGFFLFIYLAVALKKSDAYISPMFFYLSLIVLGSAIQDGIEVYGGYCRGTLDYSTGQMREYVYNTWFWPARMIISKSAFVAMVLHLSVLTFFPMRRK